MHPIIKSYALLFFGLLTLELAAEEITNKQIDLLTVRADGIISHLGPSQKESGNELGKVLANLKDLKKRLDATESQLVASDVIEKTAKKISDASHADYKTANDAYTTESISINDEHDKLKIDVQNHASRNRIFHLPEDAVALAEYDDEATHINKNIDALKARMQAHDKEQTLVLALQAKAKADEAALALARRAKADLNLQKSQEEEQIEKVANSLSQLMDKLEPTPKAP
ncbi:MAG TPA: hypothetical protein VGZ93_03625 [Candidatus Methylacidiphilales bacterium]|jgi:hypothetical protein|nr:hypothetical protein [Candidatus Methylacidiphilales bacterium]